MERWTGIPKAAGAAVRIFRETHAISAMASSTTQDTREILHCAKDLGVGIAHHIIKHYCKSIQNSFR